MFIPDIWEIRLWKGRFRTSFEPPKQPIASVEHKHLFLLLVFLEHLCVSVYSALLVIQRRTQTDRMSHRKHQTLENTAYVVRALCCQCCEPMAFQNKTKCLDKYAVDFKTMKYYFFKRNGLSPLALHGQAQKPARRASVIRYVMIPRDQLSRSQSDRNHGGP